MKSLKHRANKINDYYNKGSEILPSKNLMKTYDLFETEDFKIIFG